MLSKYVSLTGFYKQFLCIPSNRKHQHIYKISRHVLVKFLYDVIFRRTKQTYRAMSSPGLAKNELNGCNDTRSGLTTFRLIWGQLRTKNEVHFFTSLPLLQRCDTLQEISVVGIKIIACRRLDELSLVQRTVRLD